MNRAKVQNQSYENYFDLQTVCRTHFHMKGFVLRLVLKQRYKKTRKWPIRITIGIMYLRYIKKNSFPTNICSPIVEDTSKGTIQTKTQEVNQNVRGTLGDRLQRTRGGGGRERF